MAHESYLGDTAERPVQPNPGVLAERPLPGSYADLPAIIGGAVVAAALAGVFTTFGGALGLGTLSAEPGQSLSTLWVVITVLWTVITIVVSFATGGYVTGRLRRRLEAADANEISTRDGLNGLIVWGLGTLIAGWMLMGAVGGAISGASTVAGAAASAVGTAAGGLASGAGQVAGGAVSAAGSALGGVAQGLGTAASGAAQGASDDNSGAMTYITDTLLRPALEGANAASQQPVGTPARPSLDDAELSRQTGVVLGNILRTGEISDADKDFLIAATAQRTGRPQAEVEQRVDETITAVQNMRAEAEKKIADAKAEAEKMAADAKAEAERLAAEAKQAAIDAAETARKAAILSAFLLAAASVIAAGAALIGAVTGGRHRDDGRVFGGFRHG